MTGAFLSVELQHALVEEAVLRASAGRPDESEFRRARDRLYRQPDGDERERAFWGLHGVWFSRLGLGGPLHTALVELPLLGERCQRCVVSTAPTRKDESADLLVDGEVRTILILLRPSAFLDPDGLLALLRAELLHVADMVDPGFGYAPNLPDLDGGPTYTHLLQNRYRVLWDVTIAGRLARRGAADAGLIAQSERNFLAAFSMLGDAGATAFERFFATEAPTHATLLAFAVAPREAAAVEPLVPGGRCPLCRFPTHALEPDPEHMPADLVACVTQRFPAWHPAHGLCRQCADLYRARGMSLAAAARLPGSREHTSPRC